MLFPTPWRRLLTLLALVLTAAALVLTSPPRRAEADGSFISAPGRVDTVYDLKRATLYISHKRWTSTSSGSTLAESGVLRFHVPTNSFLSPIPIYGDLMGLDLSPDGDTLLVADRFYSADKVWVHQVDLRNLTHHKAEVPRDGTYEGGTFAVAFGNDGRALVTSTFLGSGWTPLRRYDPATGTWSTLGTVTQDVMVSSSPDGSMIAFAEANISDGRWGSYRVLDGDLVRREWYENGTSWFNYEIGVKNQGAQYAIPTYGGTHIYDGTYARQRMVGTYAGPQPIGVAYHPFEDLVYFAWADWASDAYSPWVRAHRTTDFAVVAQFDFQNHFDHPGNTAFQEGRLRIARDGSYLFGTVQGGVRFVRVGPNRAVAGNQTVRGLEDTPVAIPLSGHSPTSSISYEIVTAPKSGSLTGTAPDLVYTPLPDANGIDSFTFRVHDGTAYSNTATVSVAVGAINDAPSFVKGADQTVSVGALAQTVPSWATQLSAGPADENGQTLSFLVTNDNPGLFSAQPTLSSNGTLTYTPAPMAAGEATVTVRLQDNGGTVNGGVDTSAPQTFLIRVVASGHPPTAVDDTGETAEDTAVEIDVLANDSDPDGDALTLAAVGHGRNGKVEISAGKARYAPTSNFNGTDSFQYTVRDSTGLSATGTVRVTIAPVNDVPFAIAQGQTTNEDTAKPLTLIGSDPDGDPLTFTVASGPAHGTLSGTAPNLTYTPAPDYVGADSFTFTVSDGQGESAPATVTLTVTAVNDPPVAVNDTASTNEDTPIDILVLANDTDPEGDPLTISGVKYGNSGPVEILSGKVRYFPARNFYGTATFTYTIRDTAGATATATVQVTVAPVNDPPLARAASITTPEDTPQSLMLSGFDPDGDPLTYALVSGPAHGMLQGTLPNLTYTPAANYAGPDSVTFTVTDGQATSAPATASISVTAVNDAPRAIDDSATTLEDTAVQVDVLANDTDSDGDPLTLQAVTQGTNGLVEIAGGLVRYTPAANFNGADSFTYTVRDPAGLTATATVRVTVNPVNDPPSAVAQSVTTAEDTAKSITLGGADPEGNALTFAVTAGPAHGTVTGTLPNLTYTPATNYYGPDSFSFTVSDGQATSLPATVTIQVTPVNDLPRAVADSATAAKNSAIVIAVLANDTDPDGDALRVSGASAALNGSVTVSADGSVRYTPKKGYTGTDRFTYMVSDGNGGTATATVTVTVGNGKR